MRRLSPYLTRLLLGTGISPNGVTWLMIWYGLAAAAALSGPGLLWAVVAVLLIQVQLLLDCSDGELARWVQHKSPVGVYLDRIGHWLTEAALPIALGVRADGGWDELGTYTALGLLIAVLVLLIKGESALVTVARAESGLPPAGDTRAVAAPRASGLRRLRRAAGIAAVLPRVRGDGGDAARARRRDRGRGRRRPRRLAHARGRPWWWSAAITAIGHLLAILTSDRLR